MWDYPTLRRLCVEHGATNFRYRIDYRTSQQNRMDSDRPFGQPWLDSCYGETILPGSPWHKVRHVSEH